MSAFLSVEAAAQTSDKIFGNNIQVKNSNGDVIGTIDESGNGGFLDFQPTNPPHSDHPNASSWVWLNGKYIQTIDGEATTNYLYFDAEAMTWIRKSGGSQYNGTYT